MSGHSIQIHCELPLYNPRIIEPKRKNGCFFCSHCNKGFIIHGSKLISNKNSADSPLSQKMRRKSLGVPTRELNESFVNWQRCWFDPDIGVFCHCTSASILLSFFCIEMRIISWIIINLSPKGHFSSWLWTQSQYCLSQLIDSLLLFKEPTSDAVINQPTHVSHSTSLSRQSDGLLLSKWVTYWTHDMIDPWPMFTCGKCTYSFRINDECYMQWRVHHSSMHQLTKWNLICRPQKTYSNLLSPLKRSMRRSWRIDRE